MHAQSKAFWAHTMPKRLRPIYFMLGVQLLTISLLFLTSLVNGTAALLMSYSAGIIVIGISDTRTRLIPDPIVIWCGLVAVLYHLNMSGIDALIMQFIFAILFSMGTMALFLFVASSRLGSDLSGRGVPSPILGFGDLKLLAVVCLLLKPADVLGALFLTILVILVLRCIRSEKIDNPLTFATYFSPCVVLMVIQLRFGF